MTLNEEKEEIRKEIDRQLNLIHMRVGDIERNLAKVTDLVEKL